MAGWRSGGPWTVVPLVPSSMTTTAVVQIRQHNKSSALSLVGLLLSSILRRLTLNNLRFGTHIYTQTTLTSIIVLLEVSLQYSKHHFKRTKGQVADSLVRS